MITLLTIDDDPIVQGYLDEFIRSQDDLCLRRASTDSRDALNALDRESVDVVLLDYVLAEGDSAQTFLSRLSATQFSGRNRPRVLCLTGHKTPRLPSLLRRLGAHGLVEKTRVGTDLLAAIRAVALGLEWWGGEAAPVYCGTRRALVADSDRGVNAMLAAYEDGFYFSTRLVWTTDAAAECLAAESFDVMFLDSRLPGRLSGMDLIARAGEVWPNLAVVLLAADPAAMDWGYLPGENVVATMLKPVAVKDIDSLTQVLAERVITGDNPSLRRLDHAAAVTGMADN